jgi:hypothetical protein
MGEMRKFLVSYCMKGISVINDAVIKLEKDIDEFDIPARLKIEVAKAEGETSVFHISPNNVILMNFWEIN